MFKNTLIWLPRYLSRQVHKNGKASEKKHLIFCLVDHFEPRVGDVGLEKELARVEAWIQGYTRAIAQHIDSSGQRPKYTFFYPIDEFNPEVFEKISNFCKGGLGEVEVHLHHQNDTEASLKEKLAQAVKIFSSYGHLCKNKLTGEIKFGFIHGNWALANSRRDGKWCGVNNELEVLSQAGCYADFTLPSAPSDTQTRKINSIYYAQDNGAPKSHDSGINVEVGKITPGGLMLVQGPLALNWKSRKYGVLPKIENGSITLENPPTPERIDLWVHQHIAVRGKEEWIFVKVHTHGCEDKNLRTEYFQNLERMYAYLEKKYNDGDKYRLHYVTAREMYNIVKAAEAGETGNPEKFRNYLLVGNYSDGICVKTVS